MISKKRDSVSITNGRLDNAPQRGDLVRVVAPEHRHESTSQGTLAVVVSPVVYNERTGLMLVCPIREIDTGYPFGVQLPARLEIPGCILADQVRCLNWQDSQVVQVNRVPAGVTADVLQLLQTLLGDEPSPGNQQQSSLPQQTIPKGP